MAFKLMVLNIIFPLVDQTQVRISEPGSTFAVVIGLNLVTKGNMNQPGL
jgi:hypothetical protein